LQIEGLHEVLPEPKELLGNVRLTGSSGGTRAKSSANGLLNPDNIGKVDPGVWILDGLVGTVLPKERAILLEETLERRAARLCYLSADVSGMKLDKPTPPFNQIRISSHASGFSLG
jgi:hypothetical protein